MIIFNSHYGDFSYRFLDKAENYKKIEMKDLIVFFQKSEEFLFCDFVDYENNDDEDWKRN